MEIKPNIPIKTPLRRKELRERTYETQNETTTKQEKERKKKENKMERQSSEVERLNSPHLKKIQNIVKCLRFYPLRQHIIILCT